MSDVQQAPDWWVASDGKWYPPSSHPARGPGATSGFASAVGATYPSPSAVASGPANGTAVVAVISGGVTVGASVTAVVAFLIAIQQRQVYLDARVNSVAERNAFNASESAAGVAFLLGLLGLLALLVFTVLLIVWSYGAYRFIEGSSAEGRTWSRGWAVGAWFVPVANAVLPFLVLSEVDRVVRAGAHGAVYEWKRTSLSGWFVAWAAVFIGSFAIQLGAFGLQVIGLNDVASVVSVINVLTYAASIVPAAGFVLTTDRAIRASANAQQQLVAG